MDGHYRTPNLHLQVRPNTTSQMPPIVCSNNAAVQISHQASTTLHLGFRGSGVAEEIYGLHIDTKNLMTFVFYGMLIREH